MKLRVLVAAALAMTMTTAPVLAADMAEDAMMGDPMATECYEKANMETDTAMKDMKMAECQEMYPDAMMDDEMMHDDAMMEGDAMK